MTTPEQNVSTVAVPAKRSFEDLTGRRFGRWSVISYAGRSRCNQHVWTCLCECGTTRVVPGQSLRSGKSSGCRKHSKPGLLKDITGQRFGKFLVLSRAGKTKANKSLWLCKCDCKEERIVTQGNLVSGGSTNCGCQKIERLRETHTTHGHTTHGATTRTYRSWQAMWTRCTNPNTPGWHLYGGRGIEVCAEWCRFEVFYADMKDRPVGKSLDRINVDLGYSPANCQWATNQEQAKNKRPLTNNKTGVSGVQVYKGRTYQARATINGVRLCVGYFSLDAAGLQAAAEAIKAAKRLDEVLS